MIQADTEDETRGNWRDIIILLRGDLRAGSTAAQVLADVLVVDELPELFHELCTRYLVTKEWTARMNAGSTIKSLCKTFAADLIPLITRSRSDGEVLCLAELDIFAVSNCKDAELLAGNSNVEKQVEGRDLYSKSWLQKQRRALRKRLGLEAFTVDAAVAVDYISVEVFVNDSDLTGGSVSASSSTLLDKNANEHHKEVETAAAASTLDNEVITEDMNENEAAAASDQSTETWFARYAMCMSRHHNLQSD